MLHRHVNVMEYIENNIAVLVTVYGINQERRHYKKRSNEHNYMSLVVRKPVSLRKHVNVIYRGYSNFLLNMAFISPSEVENIYIS